MVSICRPENIYCIDACYTPVKQQRVIFSFFVWVSENQRLKTGVKPRKLNTWFRMECGAVWTCDLSLEAIMGAYGRSPFCRQVVRWGESHSAWWASMGGVHGCAGNLWQSKEMKLLQGSQANQGTFFLLCHFSHPSLSQIPKHICADASQLAAQAEWHSHHKQAVK